MNAETTWARLTAGEKAALRKSQPKAWASLLLCHILITRDRALATIYGLQSALDLDPRGKVALAVFEAGAQWSKTIKPKQARAQTRPRARRR